MLNVTTHSYKTYLILINWKFSKNTEYNVSISCILIYNIVFVYGKLIISFLLIQFLVLDIFVLLYYIQ